MRWLWIVVLALACESAPPSKPPARDDAARVIPDALVRKDDTTRLAQLDRLYTRLGKITRPRSPVEAPLELTNAYVDYVFSYGYARLGNVLRARELSIRAHAVLDTVRDPTHEYLMAAFEARIAQALGGERPHTPLSMAVLSGRAKLDRIGIYKVDRLREVSQTLSAGQFVDAIGAFSKKVTDPRGPEVNRISDAISRYDRSRAILGVITAAKTASERAKVDLIGAAFDFVFELPPQDAKPALVAMIALVEELPRSERSDFYGRAFVVADYFGFVDLVLQLEPVVIAKSPDDQLDFVLGQILPVFRRTNDQIAARKLVAAAKPTSSEPWRDIVWVGAALSYGDAKHGQAQLDRIHTALETESITLTTRLGIHERLSRAYALAPVDAMIRGTNRMVEYYADITDSFGTNSHYSLSVIGFVDSLVRAVL